MLGLNSAHGLTIKDGRLNRMQIRAIGDRFASAIRLLVTHHPLVALPRGANEAGTALRGAHRALAAVKAAGVHLVLAGHHHAHTVAIAGPRLSIDPQVIVVQAGTATAYRRRGTPNSFNLIHLGPASTEIAEWISDGGPFSCPAPGMSFVRNADGWATAPASATPASS